MIKTAAIIPAGGIGRRMGLPLPKQFYELDGVPLLIHTLKAFERAAAIDLVIIVVPDDFRQTVSQTIVEFGLRKIGKVVAGGRFRQDSVGAGLQVLPDEVEIVAVHDGVRPFVEAATIDSVIAAAEEHGAAMVAVPTRDTLKKVDNGFVSRTVDRENIWQAQTPQAARKHLLLRAFEHAAQTGFVGTDEASLLENIGVPVHVVPGSERNLKITRPDDLSLAEALAGAGPQSTGGEWGMHRIGHGYDAHRFAADRKLILGGVEIEHQPGLAGHSDADVLTHALCDAILGALCQGDIGRHFPDSEPQYKGISSLELLKQVCGLMRSRGYELDNADITVVAQEPRLAPYIGQMRDNLSATCAARDNVINIKATTTEKMGFTGRGEGMAAHALVMLTQKGLPAI